MTANLRDALAAGEEHTPAGVDLRAVRRRATRIRRRRVGVTAGAAAVLTALAVVVPFALRGDPSAPTARPATPVASCPDRAPVGPPNSGPRLDTALVPMPTVAAAVCTFQADGRLGSVFQLGPAEAEATVARLEAPPAVAGAPGGPCPDPGIAVPSFALRVAGADRSVLLRFGCASVDNGVVVKPVVDTSFLQELSGLATRAVACPRLPGGVPVTLAPVPALLPGATRRLVVCAYTNGSRFEGQTTLEGDAARTVVDRLNAAPALVPGAACPRQKAALVLLPVTPDGVGRADLGPYDCGRFRAGLRTAQDPELASELYRDAIR
jgi:hypothetical protein